MSSPLNKLPSAKLSLQTIVLAAIAWGVLAILFFLLFSVKIPGPDGVERRADWYIIGTNIFEAVAYLGAFWLCFRNWRSPNIVSGRNVWLGIGLGMLSYFIGGLIFGYVELVLNQDPIVSPGDIFFLATYVFLGWGMISAVRSRRLNLERWQWGTVAGIAVFGILLAIWISSPASPQPEPAIPAVQQTKPAQPNAIASPKAPALNGKPPTPTSAKTAKPTVNPASEEQPSNLENFLETWVGIFYTVCDVLLLIIATMLLLAFWGGRFSQSWRMIAAASFSLYIADMWLKYAERFPDYQSGALLEVFWVISGVLFAIGAALEYDISSRSRRAGGRRRAG